MNAAPSLPDPEPDPEPAPDPDPSAVTPGRGRIGHLVPGGLSALAGEFIGTLALVFFAVGTAIFADVRAGVTGIALAFGFVLIALVYTLGTVSGCHVNPAVTFGWCSPAG